MRPVERKAFIIGLILITAATPPFFIQLNEATRALNTWKLLAKIGSLGATVLFVWQFLLGYRQAVARWLTPDYLWALRVHRLLGVGGFVLLLLHPTFITPYYLTKHGLRLFAGGLPPPLDVLVPLGLVALGLLGVIVLTSTLLRSVMGRRAWYVTHLGAYLMLPLAFVHGYPIGSTLQGTGLRYGWQGLFVLTGAFYVLRILARFGVFSAPYELADVRPVARDVVELTLRPLGRRLQPAAGQFAFFRRGPRGSVRPFTVSRFDAETGRLSITVKALGRSTRALQTATPGERILVDGPYGTFGRAALETDRHVVMLAGGIGITPFLRIIDELKRRPGREAFLFYGNQQEADIAHRQELEAAGHVDLIHVLSGVEEHATFEVGFITPDLLRSRLEEPPSRYEFLICGPPEMVAGLESDLRSEGVPRRQIRHELFEY